jgi:hypothetical protein
VQYAKRIAPNQIAPRIAADCAHRHAAQRALLIEPYAADDAFRVGQEHNLEQQSRRISRSPDRVVAVTCFDSREANRAAIEQVVQRVFRATGSDLMSKINSEQSMAVVNELEARHRLASPATMRLLSYKYVCG